MGEVIKLRSHLAPREANIAAKYGSMFQQLLIAGDVRGLMKLHAHVHPELPPQTFKQAEYTMHLARTEAESVPMKLRKYSDRWLRSRGFGSHLPERHQLHPGERR